MIIFAAILAVTLTAAIVITVPYVVDDSTSNFLSNAPTLTPTMEPIIGGSPTFEPTTTNPTPEPTIGGSPTPSPTFGTDKMNIIISLADDMGHSDIGYYNDKIHTPTLDALAADGIKLDRHYTYKFCSPSRSMLMTGKWPHTHGQHTDINLNPVPQLPCAIQEGISTLGETMQKNGYKTHAFGKWHLGHYLPKFIPTNRGMGSFVGIYAGGSSHMSNSGKKMLKSERCACDTNDSLSLKTQTCSNPNVCSSAFDIVNETNGVLSLVNPDRLNGFNYADTFLASEAARVITAHDQTNPIFLYLAWLTPHSPVQSPSEFQDLNPRVKAAAGSGSRLKFAGMLSALDDANRIVIDALKDNNMWDNTLFIFASDNGGASSTLPGRNYPYRGAKHTNHEGGIRTPSFVYSPNPNIIPIERRGVTHYDLVSIVDWSATILGAINAADTNGDFASDSINQWPVFTTGLNPPRMEIPVQIFSEAERYIMLYVDGDRILKYIDGYPGQIKADGYLNPDRKITPGSAIDKIIIPEELESTDPQYNATVNENKGKRHDCVSKPCIFDVTSDPSEIFDLADDLSNVPTSTRLAIQEMIVRHKVNEMDFVGSDLCFVDNDTFQASQKSNRRFDKHAILIARLCGAYVPWYADPTSKLLRDASNCPPVGA